MICILDALQVVAGTNYFLDLELTDASGKKYPVAVTMWSRPWLEGRNDLGEGEAPWILTACNYSTN